LLNFVYNHEILIQKNTYNYQNKMPWKLTSLL
jgi:hypothetical protein